MADEAPVTEEPQKIRYITRTVEIDLGPNLLYCSIHGNDHPTYHPETMYGAGAVITNIRQLDPNDGSSGGDRATHYACYACGCGSRLKLHD